jgi:phosphate transport system substrate-binding protein
MNSSKDLVGYVRMHPRALGIVGVSWLHGRDEELTVFALGDPSSRPDTTQPLGRFYTPHQAHIHRRYYPVTESIYMYNRAIQRDAGYGFISFVASAPGQKIFLNNGLVPVTMPVRLVSLTSIAR